jgi:CBS domain-containing protein
LCPIVGHLGENVGYLVLYPYPARTSVERKEMNLSELVGGTIVTAGVKTPLFELATKMEAEGVGSIAITDANGEFVGIVTDRDIVIAVAHSSEISTPAEEVMTVAPDMVEIDTDVSDAVSWLNATGYRHLPVTDDGKLVDIVSIKDLLWAISDN